MWVLSWLTRRIFKSVVHYPVMDLVIAEIVHKLNDLWCFFFEQYVSAFENALRMLMNELNA